MSSQWLAEQSERPCATTTRRSNALQTVRGHPVVEPARAVPHPAMINAMPRPKAMAAIPNETTEVNSEARRKRPSSRSRAPGLPGRARRGLAAGGLQVMLLDHLGSWNAVSGPSTASFAKRGESSDTVMRSSEKFCWTVTHVMTPAMARMAPATMVMMPAVRAPRPARVSCSSAGLSSGWWLARGARSSRCRSACAEAQAVAQHRAHATRRRPARTSPGRLATDVSEGACALETRGMNRRQLAGDQNGVPS